MSVSAAVVSGIAALIAGGLSAYGASKASSSGSGSSTSGTGNSTSVWDYAPSVVTSASDAYSSYYAEKKEEERYEEQKEREDNAYQRAVADMTAAGINPASAFGQSGAAASSSATYDAKAYLEAAQITAGINLANKQAQNYEADTSLKGAQEENINQNTQNSIVLTEAQVKEIISRTGLNNAEIEKLQAELPAVLAESKLREFNAEQELDFCSVLGISSKDKDRAVEIMQSGDYVMTGAFILMNASPDFVNAFSKYGGKLLDFITSKLESVPDGDGSKGDSKKSSIVIDALSGFFHELAEYEGDKFKDFGDSWDDYVKKNPDFARMLDNAP